jgi:uncharacterized membrane protein YfcA
VFRGFGVVFEYLVYIVAGAVVSMIGSMSGIGGGVFMVPLFYHMGLHIEKAVGTSLFIIVFNAISASISYWRRGLLKPRSWLLLALIMVPSSMIGAQIASVAPRALVKTVVALIVLVYGLNLMLRGSGRSLGVKLNNKILVPVAGVTAGLVAGLSGIGGGAILMPILISILGLPVHEAVATSMLSIVVTSASGSIVHIANGNVVFRIAIPFALGAVVGAQVGSAIASRMRSKTLTIVVGLVLVTVGVLTLLR